jgi:hypothetical protein
VPDPEFGATLRIHDAARALVAAPTLPSGIYNVCRDGASRALDQGRVAA